jgi:glycosyltransferase involved in cell wall biosynthesis
MTTCLVVGAHPGDLTNFRRSLIEAMVARGVRVVAVANGRDPEVEAGVAAMGATYRAIPIARAGLNPWQDLQTIRALRTVMREVRPDVVFSYMIKPIIYGSWAARWAGVTRIYAMVEGLGTPFMPAHSLRSGVLRALARALYRVGLRRCHKVFVLNPDDERELQRRGFVTSGQTVRLNGIGIDLERFARAAMPPAPPVRFLMMARLLADKGVREFVAAATRVKAKAPDARFLLAGDIDDNADSITAEELATWRADGAVECPGWVPDVRPLVRAHHVFVLPSRYREGVPRTLLEALSTGRAIITTDNVGCRECVESPGAPDAHGLRTGHNGVLVPVGDRATMESALEAAMMRFVADPSLAERFGQAGRAYAEARFDVHAVDAMVLREMGL